MDYLATTVPYVEIDLTSKEGSQIYITRRRFTLLLVEAKYLESFQFAIQKIQTHEKSKFKMSWFQEIQ